MQERAAFRFQKVHMNPPRICFLCNVEKYDNNCILLFVMFSKECGLFVFDRSLLHEHVLLLKKGVFAWNMHF